MGRSEVPASITTICRRPANVGGNPPVFFIAREYTNLFNVCWISQATPSAHITHYPPPQDIVESRDHVEGALATVRPQYTHKIKRSGELLLQKKTPRAPDTPKTTENPLNLLNESRKQMKARTMGKSKGPGPAGPGIARRKKTLVSETDGTKAKLVCTLLRVGSGHSMVVPANRDEMRELRRGNGCVGSGLCLLIPGGSFFSVREMRCLHAHNAPREVGVVHCVHFVVSRSD